VTVVWPPNGATLGPVFTLQVSKTNFVPSLELEGKPNLAGYGHYHLFVDMDMASLGQSGRMMSMAGVIGMPASDSIPVDSRTWPDGQHTITVEPVQDDHTPIKGAMPGTVTFTLQGATAAAQSVADR
jgi:hypothetical protein